MNSNRILSRSRMPWILLAGGVAASATATAWAHPGHFGHPAPAELGFADGCGHPFQGWDHLLAILAAGLLAARAGGSAVWMYPGVLLAGLLAGGMMAATGVPGYGVEYALALSVIAFGGLLASVRVPSRRWEMSIIAAFAMFQGHAHFAELGSARSNLEIAAGFLLGTAVLLAAGIAAGLTFRGFLRMDILRIGGGVIAAAGALMLATLLG